MNRPEDETHQDGITRGDLLKAAGVAAPGAPARRPCGRGARRGRARASRPREVAGMNVLVFLTDQQRAIQHFPPRLGQAQHAGPHPPAAPRPHASRTPSPTPACARRRARRCMSGYFPAQHGVKYTLETDMPAPQYPQVELADRRSRTPPRVVAAAGYTPSTRASSTASSRRTARPGSPPTSTSTASRAGTRRTRAPTRTSRRRAAGSTTTTAAS